MEMDANSVDDATVSITDNDPGGGIDAISLDNGTSEHISSEKEVIREAGSALIRLELDIAWCSEKLVNMNLLMMHVAARESNFEVFSLEKEDMGVDSDGKALEFDILSGIFDLEVREMDRFIGTLETELNSTCEVISLYKHLGEDFWVLEEKLLDAEESIKQLQEQVSELVIQSTKFHKILSSINPEETSDEDKEAIISGDDDFYNITAKLNKLTSQQHRHVLRMLEKSLARELELENELKQCMQFQDDLKHKLHTSEQEVLSAEEETAAVYTHFMEAENASLVFMGISKDLINKLQLCQFKMNTRVQNLEEKKVSMQEFTEKSNSEALALKEKVNALEEELGILKNNGVSVQKVEKQLRETEIKLEEAMSAMEAGQEKQTMLYASISDMEVLIEKLKLKVVEANAQTESAEDRCIILSESHEELIDELNFLRSKVGSLEVSLQQAEEAKLVTAKDIKSRAKVITDMVMQLAVERERLHNQMALLMKENKALVDKLHMENKVSSNSTNHEGGETEKGVLSSEHHSHSVEYGNGSKEDSDATAVEKFPEDVFDYERKLDPHDLDTKLETVRTIDARRLNVKYVFSASLVVLSAVLALCFIHPENCPF